MTNLKWNGKPEDMPEHFYDIVSAIVRYVDETDQAKKMEEMERKEGKVLHENQS